MIHLHEIEYNCKHSRSLNSLQKEGFREPNKYHTYSSQQSKTTATILENKIINNYDKQGRCDANIEEF